MKVGKDAVVMGNVPVGTHVGDGSVVIGATDVHGNTIINTPMAVGRNASASTNSIAIGAGANAGGPVNPAALIHELVLLAKQNGKNEAVSHLHQLADEINKPAPDNSNILKAWEGVKALAAVNGAHTLLSKLAPLLGVTLA